MSSPTIFGREPAAVVGFIESVLATLLSFGVLKFIGIDTAESLGVLMAAVSAVLGVYVAYATKDTLLGYVVTAFKALAALGTVYGLSLNEQQSGLLIALITAGFALYQRTQTGPAVYPSLDLGQHSLAGRVT